MQPARPTTYKGWGPCSGSLWGNQLFSLRTYSQSRVRSMRFTEGFLPPPRKSSHNFLLIRCASCLAAVCLAFGGGGGTPHRSLRAAKLHCPVRNQSRPCRNNNGCLHKKGRIQEIMKDTSKQPNKQTNTRTSTQTTNHTKHTFKHILTHTHTDSRALSRTLEGSRFTKRSASSCKPP